MNELHAKFRNEGLSIVGVTYESAEKTDPWIEKHGVEHAYAYDKGQRLQGWFGIGGIPHAVLIDPYGTIVWRGHPARLDEATLRSALAGSFPVPVSEWPREAEPIVAKLASGDLAAAMGLARESSVKVGSRRVVELLEGHVEDLLKAMESAFEAQDYLTARRMAATAVRAFDGLEGVARAKAVQTRLEKDADVRRVLQGQERLEELRTATAEVRKVSEAKQLVTALEELARSFKNTGLGRAAEAEAAALRKRIEKSTR